MDPPDSAPLSGETRVAAVIGDPVRHSMSPTLHNAAFAATGLDWVFVALEVRDGWGPAALDAMRALGLGGLSVTMPHKEAVVAVADERSAAVETLGAANCIVPMGDGRLRAENTDGAGFLAGLADDADVIPTGLSFVVLGAGGAARAVVAALADADAAEVVVVNRTPSRAESAAALAGDVGRVGSVGAVEESDVIINATSVGMGGEPELPCPTELIRPGQLAFDLIYGHQRTRWLTELGGVGVEAHDGLSMLVHQAATAFTHWTGVDAPVAAMRAAAAARSGTRGR